MGPVVGALLPLASVVGTSAASPLLRGGGGGDGGPVRARRTSARPRSRAPPPTPRARRAPRPRHPPRARPGPSSAPLGPRAASRRAGSRRGEGGKEPRERERSGERKRPPRVFLRVSVADPLASKFGVQTQEPPVSGGRERLGPSAGRARRAHSSPCRRGSEAPGASGSAPRFFTTASAPSPPPSAQPVRPFRRLCETAPSTTSESIARDASPALPPKKKVWTRPIAKGVVGAQFA